MVGGKAEIFKHKHADGNEQFITMSYEKYGIDRILDDIIETDKQEFKCHYCGDALKRKDIGGVLPGDADEIIYLCSSLMCLIEYHEEFIIEVEADEGVGEL